MNKDLIKFILLLVFIIGAMFMAIRKDSDKQVLSIAFLGDSITEFGWLDSNGYVRQVVSKLNSMGYKIIPVPAGIRANTSQDILDRIDRDVISKNPDIVLFMGGLNDIWLNKGTVETYKANVEKIISNVQEKDKEIILMNLSLITYDLKCAQNLEVDKYNKVLAQIAKDRSIELIDINTEFKNAVVASGEKSGLLMQDGVHMTEKGNSLIAKTVVENFIKTHGKD